MQHALLEFVNVLLYFWGNDLGENEWDVSRKVESA